MPADPVGDIVLAGRPYRLARPDQLGRGGRSWSVETIGASIAKISESEGRYGNQPAEVELPMVWRTAHLGYGDDQQRGEGRYFYAEGMDCRFPERILPGPKVTTIVTGITGGNVVKFIEHEGELKVFGGRYAKTIDTTDDTVHSENDFGAGKVLVDAELFNGAIYVGMGFAAADYIWKCNSTGTWTQDDDVHAGYLVALKDRLWASSSAYQVKSVAADPMVATDWSAAYTVGDPGTSITGLSALDELLYIGKRDGLFILDSSGIAAQVTPELRAFKHADNGIGLKPWHGYMWLPHLRGLLQYSPMGDTGFAVASVGPGRDATSDCPVRGEVTALAGDDRWLYVAVYTLGGDTWLVAGREAGEGETQWGRMLWHPLAKIAGVKCQAMHISGLWTNPRLWFGLGANVGYIVLPRYTDNPQVDTSATYATSGKLYLSAHSWYTPTTKKVWKAIEVEADNLNPTRYLDVYYRVDGGTWTLAGRAEVSPKHVLSLLGASQTGVEGHRIEIRADLSMVGSTTPIVLRSIVARAAERPSQVTVYKAAIQCADHLPMKNGLKCPRSGATMLSELRELARLNQAVTLKDVVGTSQQVLVLAPVQEQEVYQEGVLQPEVIAYVRMAVFGVDATDWVTVPFALSGSAGGMVIPLAIPWAVGSPTIDVHQTLTCENPTETLAIYTITGPITNPVIENETTGCKLDLTGTTIAAGSAYIIDTIAVPKTVVDDAGVDRSANLTADSNLSTMHLAPGANVFHLTGAGATAATAMTCGYLRK